MKNQNTEYQNIIANAINTFGNGQHPIADVETLKYFSKEYQLKCMRKAIKNAKSGSEELLNEVYNSIK